MTDDIGKSVQRRLNVQVVEPLKQRLADAEKVMGEMAEYMNDVWGKKRAIPLAHYKAYKERWGERLAGNGEQGD